MKRSASAPSTTLWSKEHEKYAQVRIAIVSSPSGPVMTLGRFSMAPSPRIAEVPSGMIGVPRREPNTPGLVMVKVALHFLRFEALGPRAIGEVIQRFREAGQ